MKNYGAQLVFEAPTNTDLEHEEEAIVESILNQMNNDESAFGMFALLKHVNVIRKLSLIDIKGQEKYWFYNNDGRRIGQAILKDSSFDIYRVGYDQNEEKPYEKIIDSYPIMDCVNYFDNECERCRYLIIAIDDIESDIESENKSEESNEDN